MCIYTYISLGLAWAWPDYPGLCMRARGNILSSDLKLSSSDKLFQGFNCENVKATPTWTHPHPGLTTSNVLSTIVSVIVTLRWGVWPLSHNDAKCCQMFRNKDCWLTMQLAQDMEDWKKHKPEICLCRFTRSPTTWDFWGLTKTQTSSPD